MYLIYMPKRLLILFSFEGRGSLVHKAVGGKWGVEMAIHDPGVSGRLTTMQGRQGLGREKGMGWLVSKSGMLIHPTGVGYVGWGTYVRIYVGCSLAGIYGCSLAGLTPHIQIWEGSGWSRGQTQGRLHREGGNRPSSTKILGGHSPLNTGPTSANSHPSCVGEDGGVHLGGLKQPQISIVQYTPKFLSYKN